MASPFLGRCSAIVLLLTATFVSTWALAADTAATLPSDGGMAARLQPFIDNHVLAGAVVLVADKDKILDLEAVGYSDLAAKKLVKTTDLFYYRLDDQDLHRRRADDAGR